MSVNEGSGVGEYNLTIDHVSNGEEASEVVFRRPSINLENRTEALKAFANAEEIRINIRLAEHEVDIRNNSDRLDVIEVVANSAMQPLTVVAAAVNFTAENGKLYAVAGTVDVQLPAPSNKFYCVIKDASANIAGNPINIVRSGTEKIDGIASNFAFTSNNEAISLISDGTDWFIY